MNKITRLMIVATLNGGRRMTTTTMTSMIRTEKKKKTVRTDLCLIGRDKDLRLLFLSVSDRIDTRLPTPAMIIITYLYP